MPKVGDRIGGGALEGYSWDLTYVGGVGQMGVGNGVFNWQVIIRKGGTDVAAAWLAGDDEDLAIRFAKHTFREVAGIPPNITI